MANPPTQSVLFPELGEKPVVVSAIVKYHRLTGSPEAAHSILLALDWLMSEGLTADGQTFQYLTADAYSGKPGHPDLNMLIVHAFGYGFRLSGYENQKYLNIGLKVFNRGVKKAYLKKQKHFNQNYRSSGHFLAYINDGYKQALENQAKQFKEKAQSNAFCKTD